MPKKSRSDPQYALEFVNWFRKLADAPNTLRIFNRDTYYTIYGQYTKEIALEYFRTAQSISHYGPTKTEDGQPLQQLKCVHIKPTLIQSIIHDYLVRKNKNIEIYEKDSDGWQVTKKATPGNVSGMDELIDTMNMGNSGGQTIVMAVTLHFSSTGQRNMGIAMCNTTTQRFEVVEMIDNQQFSNLQAVAVGRGVKECIFYCEQQNAYQEQLKKFRVTLTKCGVTVIDTTRDIWKAANDSTILTTNETMITQKSKKQLLTLRNGKHSMRALYGLIQHLELMSDTANHYKYSLHQYRETAFMKLDAPAMAALNLFPSITDTNKNMSVYGLLNKCKTPMGSRLLSNWIRQPLVDINAIRRRQKLVRVFVHNSDVRDRLSQQHLKSIPDLEKILVRLQRKKCDLKDCVTLYNGCERIAWIRRELEDCTAPPTESNDPSPNTESKTTEDDDTDGKIDADDVEALVEAAVHFSPIDILKRQFIDTMAGMENDFNNYMAMVESVIDLEATQNREYLIKADFDETLQIYSQTKEDTRRKMKKIADSFSSKLKTAKSGRNNPVTLDHKPAYGWHLRVAKGAATKLRKASDLSFDQLATLKACALITTRQLKGLSKTYEDLQRKYATRQQQIVEKTMEITETYMPVIRTAIAVFSELDVIACFAHVGAHSPQGYVCPTVLPIGSDRVQMFGARHPCLEMQDHLFNSTISTQAADASVPLTSRNSGECIPNDVSLIKGKSAFQIVTGPNMGGKSTYIRMVGLITLMAQIGSFVPCTSATVTAVDSILARVGAGDHQTRGVSTFMAEMLETGTILQAATKDSLVIIDELGRGTSTYDGFGIAYAISEQISQKIGSFCLFATHFHELTAMADNYDGVINKHVMAYHDRDTDSLAMMYKIKDGPCDRSFGIQVAQLARFNKDVIAMARQKADELESFGKNEKMSLQTFTIVRNFLKQFKFLSNQSYASEEEKSEVYQKLKNEIQTECQKNNELDGICSKFLSTIGPTDDNGTAVADVTMPDSENKTEMKEVESM